MNWQFLIEEMVVEIHDKAINPKELQGIAKDKSLKGALARVENRLNYGLINDVYDLAANYAMVIATGHCFNDANKRTAYVTMIVCLEMNNVKLAIGVVEIAKVIIEVAQDNVDEVELADWLRKNSKF